MLIGEKTAVCPPCLEGRQCFHCSDRTSQHLGVSRVHCRLLGFSPELGQRVHFAEGTNLRCREDKKSPTDDDGSEERLAKEKKKKERKERKKKENQGEPTIPSRRYFFSYDDALTTLEA